MFSTNHCTLVDALRLRPGQDTPTDMVVPFLLHLVCMTVPCHIAAILVGGTKDPGALVADFITSHVVPGIQKRIGCRLYLLVRGDIDRAIGIKVMVRAGGNATGREIGAGIGHGSVE